MGSTEETEKRCWVTLVTKPSYMPGVIILGHTLDKHSSKYPMVVQYTSSLGDEAITALKAEGKKTGRIIPDHVELLLPREGHENTGSVAERFKDTFTKLRAFEVYKLGFTQACFLDADMAVFQNPDSAFDTSLPDRTWIACNHSCVCNLDHDPWAPSEWHKGNCAYTTLDSPEKVFGKVSGNCRPTYRLLNGGFFLFYPSEESWEKMLHHFNTTEKLKEFQFPDQDFLADYYWDKWQPVSWKYNAIKTMRYWHPAMWSDTDLVILHYIVDKPWERRVSSDGIAGHLGRDGVTHQWWWDIYDEWLKNEAKDDNPTFELMQKLVGKEEPFTEKTPLPQEPGRPQDVEPYDGE